MCNVFIQNRTTWFQSKSKTISKIQKYILLSLLDSFDRKYSTIFIFKLVKYIGICLCISL